MIEKDHNGASEVQITFDNIGAGYTTVFSGHVPQCLLFYKFCLYVSDKSLNLRSRRVDR